jgi:hypothetical protein
MADDSTELRLAKMYREEGDKLRGQANADLEAARYERGQIEHAKRIMEQTERSIAERERKLKELGEPELVAREQAAAAKLAEAKALMATYNNDKHAAAIALQQINEREKAEQSAAA